MSELTPEQHRRIETLFDEAVDMSTDGIEDYLSRACADDETVRQRVRDLLRIDRSPTAAAINPAVLRKVLDAATSVRDALVQPDQVGPYKLIQLIGSGGFGEVWLAERREPMVQRVALKIMKAGLHDVTFISRFEQERQALAVMDHPHVARVLDGGITESGRPFFVMEYVQGEPITLFADRHRLGLSDRLRLFADVCDAVQHAHHKGIIHRDIKASNVMVAMFEGKPVVKVIDFGIAKSMKSAGMPNAAHTTQAVFIGTPEYMSPEQAGIGAIDIDTRSDVYSLGVLLYELLSGLLPLRFDASKRESLGYIYVQQVIRDFDPASPSKMLSTCSDLQINDVAKARKSTGAELIAELSSELEWIPLKAIRKDRARRYASAESLANDVRRYLNGAPLEAAPESRLYLMRKFIGRNKLQVFALTVLIVALFVGVLTTGFMLSYVRSKAEELKIVSEFQRDMLSQVDAKTAGIRLRQDLLERFGRAVEGQDWLTTQEREQRRREFAALLESVNLADAANGLIDSTMLDPAATLIEERFGEPKQRRLAATLYQALADQYQVRGFYDRAAPLQNAALNLRMEVLGVDDPDTLQSMHNQAVLFMNLSQWNESESLMKTALESRRRVLGSDAPATIESVGALGVLYRIKGAPALAEPLYREALEKCRVRYGDAHSKTRAAMSGMGAFYQSVGDYESAEMWFRKALDGLEEPGSRIESEAIDTLVNLGAALKSLDKLQEADRTLQSALELSLSIFGRTHPKSLRAMHELGDLRQKQYDFSGADRYFRDGLAAALEANLGSDRATYPLAFYNRLGGLADIQDRYADAEVYYRMSYEGRREIRGPSHRETLTSLYNLGCMLIKLGRLDEAKSCFGDALERHRSTRGDSEDTLDAILRLAEVAEISRDFIEAEKQLVASITVADAVFGVRDRRAIARIGDLREFLIRNRENLDDPSNASKIAECEREIEARRREGDR